MAEGLLPEQGLFAGDGGAAVEAPLARPGDVLLDEERGTVFVADTGNGLVRRVDLATGRIETVAGTLASGAPPPSPTPATAAEVALGRPRELAWDAQARELFVLDAERGEVLALELEPDGGGAPTIRVLDLGSEIQRAVAVAFHVFEGGERRLLVADAGEANELATADPIRRPGLWSVDPGPGGEAPVELETEVPFRLLLGLAVAPQADGSASLFVAADVEEEFEDAIFSDSFFTEAIDFEVYCFDGGDDEVDSFGAGGDGLVDAADPDCSKPVQVQLLRLDLPSFAPAEGSSAAFEPQVLVTGFRRFPITETGFVPGCASSDPATLTPPTNLPDLVIEALAIGPDGQLVFSDPFGGSVGAFDFDELGGVLVVPLFGTGSPLALPHDGAPPLATPIDRPQGLALDSLENLYVADTRHNRVRRTWAGGLLAAPIPPPVAAFDVSATMGQAPLAVAFTDLSEGPVSSWRWDFGDGGTSSLREPTHVYTTAGTFDVRLTVTNPDGADTLTVPALIEVEAAIADGGFEDQTPGSPPAAPWIVGSGAGHVIHPVGGVATDGGMPTEGARWLAVSGEGSTNATPPSFPGGFTSPPAGATSVSQIFSLPPGVTRLELDAVFVNGEGGPSAGFNDFLSIDVTDFSNPFSSNFNLYYRDTLSPSVGVSAHDASPVTEVTSVSADLASLFSGSTEFELTISVGNVGDGELPSRGYVDDVRLTAP